MFHQTNTLTTGTDTVTGTAGNDTISGARIDTVQTLNSGDTIDGGAGSDTLIATLNAGTITPASITNVESIVFTALGAATVDFDNVSGVTSLTSTGSSATLLVDDIQALTTSITVSNNTAAQSFIFKDAAVAGTNTITLNLDGAADVINIGGETDADGDIETFVINASGGASDLGVGNGFGADATSITVNASAALVLGSTAQFVSATNFDASGSTAGVTAVFATRTTAGETAATFKGGSGADNFDLGLLNGTNYGHLTIDMGAGNDTLDLADRLNDTITTASTIDGGAGTDTLIVTTALTEAEGARISNFEVLNIEADAQTQDADNFSGTTFGTGNVAVNALTITNLANNSVLNVNHAMTGSLTGTLKTDTANDSVTVNIGGTGAVTLAALAISTNYENITLNSRGDTANVLTTISNANNNLTVTGATALTITGTGSLAGVLDASAHTAAFTATTGTTALTINGGAGVDTLTSGLLATGVTQTLNGGDGNDVLTAGAIVTNGTLNLNGGAGSDTINIAAMVGTAAGGGAAAVISLANINGDTGVDFITLSTSTDVAADVISTVTSVADADRVVNFTTTVDDFDYNGALLNGTTTTVVNSAAATLALALNVTTATNFIVQDNLTGTAASTLTTLADATTSSAFLTAATAFEAALVTALGTVAGLDTVVGAGESVLLTFRNGADSVVVRFTNSDTTVANTVTVAEIDVVAVFDAAILVAADII